MHECSTLTPFPWIIEKDEFERIIDFRSRMTRQIQLQYKTGHQNKYMNKHINQQHYFPCQYKKSRINNK